MTDLSKAAPFSRVALIWKGRRLEGILIPAPSGVRLKLDSGYNIGIRDYEDAEVLAPPSKTGDAAKREIEPPKGKRVLVLLAGGTLSSRVDYATGAVTASIDPAEIHESYPGLFDIAPVEVRFHADWMSGDMRFKHVNSLAEEILPALNDPDVLGVIVTHGTDTLHYTAAGLRFMFSHLPKPVIITGSQRSSDRPSTDARINLSNAVYAIANWKLKPTVAVLMHASIHERSCVLIEGVAARKNHSSRRDAFASINRPPLALVDFEQDRFETLGAQNYDDPASGDVTLTKLRTGLKIGIAIAHQNMMAEELAPYASFDGLILQGTGLGHFPVTAEMDAENGRILDAIAALAKKIPVVMTRQTIYGVTDMKVYGYGTKLRAAGVVGDGTDLTMEAAYMKLAYLLSSGEKDVRARMVENLKGEMNEVRAE